MLLFPYTQGVGGKQRPALVLLDAGDDDLVLARVTSQADVSAFDVALKDWQAAGLLLPSWVRLHKLATLEKRLVKRQLGQLTLLDKHAVGQKLVAMAALFLEEGGRNP